MCTLLKGAYKAFLLLHHTNLWPIIGDKSLPKLVEMNLSKVDNIKLTSAFKVFVF